MPVVSKCKILHLSDGNGGILCDGSFTTESANHSDVKNPIATSFQKQAVSDPDYFIKDQNVLSEKEVFCSNCVQNVRSTYPEEARVHIHKNGQTSYQFTYCGFQVELLHDQQHKTVDGHYLTRDGSPRIPTSANRCDNCQYGYPDILTGRKQIV